MNFLKKLLTCGSVEKNDPSVLNMDINNEQVNNEKPEFINKNILQKKHLICDDAFANRLVLKKYLVAYGCIVDEAENGLDAIEKLKNNVYNVVWMDIKMPKMDGIDATIHIRTKLNYTQTIIGLTGYVDEITIKKCKTAGMNLVVSKPFDKKVIKMYCQTY